MKTKKANSGSDDSSEEEYVVEKIMDRRVRKGKVEYYLKWKGYGEKDNTWEPVEHLECPELIKAFEDERVRKEEEKDKDKDASKGKTEKKPQPAIPSKVQKRKSEEKEKDKNSLKRKKVDSDGEGDGNKKKRRNSKSGSSDGSDEEFYDDTKNSKENGFAKGLEPLKILGATDISGQLQFLIQWEGTDQAELVPAKEANLKCPQVVIAFYEERLAWYSDDENEA